MMLESGLPGSYDALLEQLRPACFAVAYRMLGSVAEAEDVVQEAMLRLYEVLQRGDEIASPRAYAMTVTARLSLDTLRSARVRRAQYVGEWLPEPLLTGSGSDPALATEQADSLSFAFLTLLERLSPEQRAAFLLHDVFDYGYAEIASLLSTSPANARQLATRARQHLRAHKPRFEPTRAERTALGSRFFAAMQSGDVGALEALLVPDASLHGDGGGKVPALAKAQHGRDRVIHTLLAWARQGARGGGGVSQVLEVNGQPGVKLYDGTGGLIGVMVLDIAEGHVLAVRSIVNPEKLQHLGALGDMRHLLKH